MYILCVSQMYLGLLWDTMCKIHVKYQDTCKFSWNVTEQSVSHSVISRSRPALTPPPAVRHDTVVTRRRRSPDRSAAPRRSTSRTCNLELLPSLRGAALVVRGRIDYLPLETNLTTVRLVTVRRRPLSAKLRRSDCSQSYASGSFHSASESSRISSFPSGTGCPR